MCEGVISHGWEFSLSKESVVLIKFTWHDSMLLHSLYVAPLPMKKRLREQFFRF